MYPPFISLGEMVKLPADEDTAQKVGQAGSAPTKTLR